RGRHVLDAPSVPPLPGQRGPATPRGDRLQSWQSAAAARLAPRHSKLVADESPATALQDGRAPDPACPILHATACRKLLDAVSVSADRRRHRAAGVAPNVIQQTARVGSAPCDAGIVSLSGGAARK